MEHKNQWFMLENTANYNGNYFYPFTCTNAISLKYDILDMDFKISTALYWFFQNRRRNDEIQMDLYIALVKHNISMDEIFSIPLFKKLIIDSSESGKSETITKYISENEDVRKALVLRYDAFIASKLYSGDKNVTNYILKEKFGSYGDVMDFKKKNIFGDSEDDFSGITDIGKSIISIY